MVARNAALKSAEPFTTDILNEPITAEGLCSKFEVIGGGRMVEAVCDARYRELVCSAIVRVNKMTAAVQTNVVDFKTRKVRVTGGLRFNIVIDEAPGRNPTGYVIVEVSGTCEQIQLLARELADIPA
jgi:hypothetical protein